MAAVKEIPVREVYMGETHIRYHLVAGCQTTTSCVSDKT